MGRRDLTVEAEADEVVGEQARGLFPLVGRLRVSDRVDDVPLLLVPLGGGPVERPDLEGSGAAQLEAQQIGEQVVVAKPRTPGVERDDERVRLLQILQAAKPRALALTGRVADGWAAPLMNYMPPAAAAEAQVLIDRAAREAGRDRGEIRRIYNMSGGFTAAAPAPARDTDEAIVGPPDHWADVLTHFALDLGFGTFLLIAPPEPDALRTFIEDVAPQVRERVATARAHAPTDPSLTTTEPKEPHL